LYCLIIQPSCCNTNKLTNQDDDDDDDFKAKYRVVTFSAILWAPMRLTVIVSPLTAIISQMLSSPRRRDSIYYNLLSSATERPVGERPLRRQTCDARRWPLGGPWHDSHTPPTASHPPPYVKTLVLFQRLSFANHWRNKEYMYSGSAKPRQPFVTALAFVIWITLSSSAERRWLVLNSYSTQVDVARKVH